MSQSVFAMDAVRLIGETPVVRKQEQRAQGRRQVFGKVRSAFARLWVTSVRVLSFGYRAGLRIFSNL